MGPPLYMQSVVNRNVVIRRMTYIDRNTNRPLAPQEVLSGFFTTVLHATNFAVIDKVKFLPPC
jgi:hypothetical protein